MPLRLWRETESWMEGSLVGRGNRQRHLWPASPLWLGVLLRDVELMGPEDCLVKIGMRCFDWECQ